MLVRGINFRESSADQLQLQLQHIVYNHQHVRYSTHHIISARTAMYGQTYPSLVPADEVFSEWIISVLKILSMYFMLIVPLVSFGYQGMIFNTNINIVASYTSSRSNQLRQLRSSLRSSTSEFQCLVE